MSNKNIKVKITNYKGKDYIDPRYKLPPNLILINPNGEIFYSRLGQQLTRFCKQYLLSPFVINNNIDNGKIILNSQNKNRLTVLNCLNWEIKTYSPESSS